MGIKHIGKFVAYLILAVNIFFISLLLLTAYSPHIKPVVHPVESCFGLTFPIFLVINICFFIFWLIIQKYKFALFPLVAFLLCYSQIRTYFPLNFHTSKLPYEESHTTCFLPILLLGILPLLYGMATGNYYFTLFGTFLLIGSIDDLCILWKLRSFSKDAFINDCSQELRFHIW